jgi:hypothetical protein
LRELTGFGEAALLDANPGQADQPICKIRSALGKARESIARLVDGIGMQKRIPTQKLSRAAGALFEMEAALRDLAIVGVAVQIGIEGATIASTGFEPQQCLSLGLLGL